MEKTGMTRRKAFTLVVLVIGIIPFIAISIVPLVSTIFNPRPTPPISSPSPTAQAADQIKQLEAQEQGYQAVLEREPDNRAALEGLVSARLQLIQTGQRTIETVIAPLERLTKLNPDEPQYAVILAQAQQQTGNVEAAELTYESVLTQYPGNINALRGLVDLNLQQERPQAALGLVQDAISHAESNPPPAGSEPPDIVGLKLIMGDIYLSQKDFSQAQTVFAKIAQESPNDFRPVFGQAIAYQAQGKTADAAPLFTKAESLAPAEVKDQIKRAAALPTPSPAPAANPSPSP